MSPCLCCEDQGQNHVTGDVTLYCFLCIAGMIAKNDCCAMCSKPARYSEPAHVFVKKMQRIANRTAAVSPADITSIQREVSNGTAVGTVKLWREYP